VSALSVRLSIARAGFDLEAAIEFGERGVTTLTGPSGSGKTTLLRCIAGLERPREGTIVWGRDAWFDRARGIDVPAHRRAISYVTQQAHLFPHLTVRGNLEYGAKRAGQRTGAADPERLVTELGITALLGRRVEHLSGGERQRVAIGRALLARPRLLLLDEPVSALDETATADVLATLERVLAALPVPCLYVSHDLGEASRLADRMVWLESGRIVADGPAREVMSDPGLPFAQAGDARSVIAGRVESVDATEGLARVSFDGGELWIAATTEAAPGRLVRVGIGARDVSIALRRPEAISVLNVLEGRVVDVADARDCPSQALVRLKIGGCMLLARVTRRSVAELGLTPGLVAWALVKSAAIVR
jgi:molybdate transport system ATP-binding protein